MKRTYLYKVPAWLFTGVVIVAILWLTVAPKPLPDNSLPLIPGIDKIGHACMFGGLYIALCFDRGLSRFKHGAQVAYPWQWRIWIFIGVILFGLFTEFLQEWTHLGRSYDMLDFCADVFGTLVGMFVVPPLMMKLFRASAQ